MRLVERLTVHKTRREILIRCPAKVNLFLKVLGRRSDGYHEIQTVMQTVTLFDELKILRQRSGVSLTCSGEDFEGSPENNLAFKAADLFLKKGYGSGGVRIELKKNIPIAAGLGGGSSDAACCLLALNELFRGGVSEVELKSLAAQLGSDAPFFIEGGTALCTGRGEIVQPLRPAAQFSGILLVPKTSLRTTEMYASLKPGDFHGPDVELMLRAVEAGDLSRISSALFNSFQRVAFQKVPELVDLKIKLEQLGSVGVVLSGSGPSLFGVFASAPEAEVGLARLTRRELAKTRFSALVSSF
jgi:4-diphosphocytidyl-2-C-methyl-D-erythritol kinase